MEFAFRHQHITVDCYVPHGTSTCISRALTVPLRHTALPPRVVATRTLADVHDALYQAHLRPRLVLILMRRSECARWLHGLGRGLLVRPCAMSQEALNRTT